MLLLIKPVVRSTVGNDDSTKLGRLKVDELGPAGLEIAPATPAVKKRQRYMKIQ